MQPKVSVIITAYNEQEHIENAVISILNQTYKNLECIIVDDGSTDKTYEIVHKYIDQDKRILLFRKNHMGRADALNFGIQNSSGDYVAIFDADDLSYPQRIEKQIEFLQKNIGISIVGTWCTAINSDNKKVVIVKKPLSDRKIRDFVIHGKPLAHTSMMFKREVYHRINGYRNIAFRDYDFDIRALVHYRAANIGEALVHINRHSDSTTGKMGRIEKLSKSLHCRMKAIYFHKPIYLMPYYCFMLIMNTLRRILHNQAN